MKLPRAAALAGALLLLGCAETTPPPADTGAAPPPVERQVMITYPPGPPQLWARTTADLAQTYSLRTIYSWTMASLGEQCVVFEVPRDRSPQDLVRRLASDPRVGSAQTVETFQVQVQGQGTNDPYAHLQHGSQAIRLDQAHRWATGKGVKIGVVDTGVDFDHPDLRGRVVKAQSFVDQGERTFTTDIHGTAVAGLIAASANNDVGIVGVAPGAEIYALKACWQQPAASREAVCNSYTLAKAVDFAITQGVQILNFSLAGPPDPLLGRLIAHALSRGIVVVAADGGAPSRDFPASCQGVLGIMGSDDLRGGLTVSMEGKSASGKTADGKTLSTLAAPSVDILTTVPHGSYDFFSGSSLAAAQVSGIAALLLEKSPKLTPAQLAAVIRKTARPLSPSAIAQVDACAAVASLAGGGGCG
ncbi:MAG TPA: S8 family serine peptidase [Thermoanaerobaculia bacterium]|nr:S8 family serine peptidase [Thermoanaerobaculia bacterium]